MKHLYNPSHIEVISEFDDIKSIKCIEKNKFVPQFNIVGLNEKRIKQVVCDFVDDNVCLDIINKITSKSNYDAKS